MPAVSPSSSSNDSGSYAIWAVVSMLLGLLVAVLGFFALMMWLDARDSRSDSTPAAASSGTAGHDMAGMDMGATANLGSLTSYAGAAPSNADALADAHRAYP